VKHYLSYDSAGKPVGIHTHSHSGTKLGGWPDDCQLDNPTCPNPTSKWFRENIIGQNGAVGFVALNCDCSPTEGVCSCASEAFSTMKVVNGVLVDRLQGSLIKNGSLVATGSKIKAPPGTKLAFSIACVGVPDGSTVGVFHKGAIVLEESPLTLTFTSGQTPTFEVTAPAQGANSLIACYGLDILPLGFEIIGWA
jgi:hypothetical protein